MSRIEPLLMKLIVLLAISLLISCTESEPVVPQTPTVTVTEPIDLLLHNARIYTLNWPDPDSEGVPHKLAPFDNNQWYPDASVVAVKDGIIVGFGDENTKDDYDLSQARIIDLNGATLLPGFIDSHTHLSELGKLLHIVNLADVKTPEEAIERIKTASQNITAGEWIIGRGWDEGAWANNYPDKLLLDQAFPNNPVHLLSLHSFAVWVNSKAMAVAGIDKDTQPPVGGEIRRDDNGEPTGLFLNRATTLFSDYLPKPDKDVYATWFFDAMKQMMSDGYVGVHEAGVSHAMMQGLKSLQQQDRLPVRMYAMISARDQEIVERSLATGPQTDPEGFLDVVSVKAYYDGALGSRGARLLDDYTDMEGHRGLSGANYGFNQERVDALIKAGFQVGVHAIGDAGNREVLAYFAKHIEENDQVRELRHRVEHAQVIHPNDFKYFYEYDLIASMEPPHAVEDMRWAERRLGPERIRGAYAWRTFRENNVPITFNSDLPGSSHSLFYGLHAAVTRRNQAQEPMGGWYPEQVVSIEEAIRGYTIWAAYAGFRENDTGSIAQGKWADFTVLDIDPFALATTEPGAILSGQVLMTIINGEVVFQSE